MNNPFASLDLCPFRVEKLPNGNTILNLDQQLKSVEVLKPSGMRDRVILLLRHKYKLRPSEISSLNISDTDLNGGIIHFMRHRKQLIVVIDECDLLDFRRWIVVRKLYVRGLDDAFFVSMHWTRGRSEPYKRMSVRGIFLVIQKYALIGGGDE